MTVFDYIVIGFYLVFMLALGPVYKSFSKTASDYFRATYPAHSLQVALYTLVPFYVIAIVLVPAFSAV